MTAPLTFEQYAAESLELQRETLLAQRETLRVLKRLAAALAVNPERPAVRRAQAQAERSAGQGAFAASQQRRRKYGRSA